MSKKFVCSGTGLALAAASAIASAATPVFEIVQPETFDAPLALSAAWADFDKDGDLDLITSYDTGEVRLYRNDKGTFTNIGKELGLPLQGADSRGAAWGDYDGDGFPDLYVGTLQSPVAGRNYLYHNERGVRFVEVAQQMGVDALGISSRQANWIDYDKDGDLDLFVANRIGNNFMFRNDGGKFTNVARDVKLADVRRTVGSCWFDMDQDGDLDVFNGNQEADKDAFYRNDDGRFVDIAPDVGMDQSQRRLAEGSNMCSAGDYDNDGDFDLFVANYGTSVLYRNEGAGRFAEVAKVMGVAAQGHMVSAQWADYDNDGLLDLHVIGYTRDAKGIYADDHLFHNEGGRFVDVITPDHVLNRADHGVQWADFDEDGDLDVAITAEGVKGVGLTLLRNQLPREARRCSVKVSVIDKAGHSTLAGSEVRLYDSAGKLLGARLVHTGDGYGGQSVQAVHFGLPSEMRVTVEVTYLTVAGRKTQRVENVYPRKLDGKPLVVRQAE